MKNNKQKEKATPREIVTRVIAIILAALMLIGVLAVVIPFINAVEATDETGAETEAETETEDTLQPSSGLPPTIPETGVVTPETPSDNFSPFQKNDVLMRIGILYGTDVVPSLRVRTTYGFDLFTVTEKNELKYLWRLEKPDVSFGLAENMALVSGVYTFNTTQTKTVGRYHVEIDKEYKTREEAETALQKYASMAASSRHKVFPAYIDGVYKIRVGHFLTEASAKSELTTLRRLFDTGVSVTTPANTGYVAINYGTGEPLFCLEDGAERALGAYPVQKTGSEYLQTPKNNLYPGMFEFRKYESGSTKGVQLVMVSELEDYVTAVVPWEVSNTYPVESLKAFAVTVRTYAYSNFGRHSRYGFDLCDSSDCQVCLGYGRVNDNVLKAVKETAGKVLTYEGELIVSYYSAVGGGSMAGNHEVWNSTAVPYLCGKMTPWENYEQHSKGVWSFEATPEKLCSYMRSQGYTKLKDAIADIKIERLCENSTYVYSVTVTDIHGNSVYIYRNRNIRGAFNEWLNSGNFVIEHNGEIEDGLIHGTVEIKKGLTVLTASGLKLVPTEDQTLNTIGAGGRLSSPYPELLKVQTSAKNPLDCVVANQQTQTVIDGKIQSNLATKKGNFVFIGKGYGHGVGMSQIGAQDLGLAGKNYEYILTAYFTGTKLASIGSL